MVADQRAQRAEKKASWRRAIRDGLDSLTVTGPSAVLDEMCREAREAVENRPTQQPREAALNQAWAAFDRVDQLLSEGDAAAAIQAMGGGVQPAGGDLVFPPVLTVTVTASAEQDQPGPDQLSMDLARRLADFQEAQFTFHMRLQEREMSLRERALEANHALRRLTLDSKAAAERAETDRRERANTARPDFARRGQTFAMWLAGGAAIALLAGGLACIFLSVAGAVTASAGLPAAGILLAAGLFAGIANLIRNFLPRD